VLQYSISDSAKNNGKLGWIKETSLSSKIQEQVIKTKIGNLTKPIQIPGGFLILKVENKRDMEISLDVDKEINLIVKKKTNEQLDQFSNIYFKKVMKDIKINEL
jgi:peptidyl-prolyl cis-trans isomerase SurA